MTTNSQRRRESLSLDDIKRILSSLDVNNNEYHRQVYVQMTELLKQIEKQDKQTKQLIDENNNLMRRLEQINAQKLPRKKDKLDEVIKSHKLQTTKIIHVKSHQCCFEPKPVQRRHNSMYNMYQSDRKQLEKKVSFGHMTYHRQGGELVLKEH